MSNALPLAVLVTLILTIVVSLAWVGRDAQQRGRSSLVIMLLCLITWPLGFLFWRVVRPPPSI